MAIMDVFREWLGMRKPLIAPLDKKVRFFLKYGDLLVGTLSVEDGEAGSLSLILARSARIRVTSCIVEFPGVDKIYGSQSALAVLYFGIPITK